MINSSILNVMRKNFEDMVRQEIDNIIRNPSYSASTQSVEQKSITEEDIAMALKLIEEKHEPIRMRYMDIMGLATINHSSLLGVISS